MDVNLVGFVALGASIPGLFAWLRQDNRALRARVASIGGLLESVFMRRDLTPPSGPSRSRASPKWSQPAFADAAPAREHSGFPIVSKPIERW